MEKHQYHIRINPHAVALVEEGCPQETIDALTKMSELVLEKFAGKSNGTSNVTSGEDGLVNLSTSPSFKTSAKNEESAEVLNRDIRLIMLGMQFFREDLDLTSEENIGYATRYYNSIRAAGKI